MQQTIISDPDVPRIVKEDQAHLDQRKILQDSGDSPPSWPVKIGQWVRIQGDLLDEELIGAKALIKELREGRNRYAILEINGRERSLGVDYLTSL